METEPSDDQTCKVKREWFISSFLSKQHRLKPISVAGSGHMRINNSIHRTVVPVPMQHLNFLSRLEVIMRMCNDPETGASACLEDGHDSSPEKVPYQTGKDFPNAW